MTLNKNMTGQKLNVKDFIDFTYDEVSDRPGQLLISKVLLETQAKLVRQTLQNVLIMRAEFILMEGVFAYSGYSPLFERGNNPYRRYQAWYDQPSGTIRFHPDPEILSNWSN